MIMINSQPISGARLLVTGATGFIGSRLALHAHREGADVVATGRAESSLELERLEELKSAGVPVEVGLLQDAMLLKRIVADRTTVIHLAAAQHEAQMPPAHFRSVNVDATRMLLDACRRSSVRRFVYGGTIGVFGDSQAVLTEETPTFPDNSYTKTKLEAESLVRSNADAFEVCIIRIGETYGPGDYRLLKLFRAIDRGRFIMIGRGDNRRQCVHVNDLLRALLLAASHPAAIGEVFIIAGREIMTTSEMVREIAAALGRSPPRARAPLWPFQITARMLEATLPPLRIRPPLHSRRLDFFRRSFVFSTAKAHDVLGFTPEIDFPTGAVDTARWYRTRGYLAPPANRELPRAESA
jgi:nucleoside-diphosphate-sugar epimerase